MSPSSYDLVGTHCMLPLDGAELDFEAFSVDSSGSQDLIAPAKAKLGDHIIHVYIDVVSESSVRVSINNIPANPANGKTIVPGLPLDVRLPIHHLTCAFVSGTEPAVVEVIYFTGAVMT
jgi:hypothetical protein